MSKSRQLSSNLFGAIEQANVKAAQPLAARMRPRTLEVFVGQEHFLGPGKLLHRLLKADRLSSAVSHGPPGSGKTSPAHVIAAQTQSLFRPLNAVAGGTINDRTQAAAALDSLRLGATMGPAVVVLMAARTKSRSSPVQGSMLFVTEWRAQLTSSARAAKSEFGSRHTCPCRLNPCLRWPTVGAHAREIGPGEVKVLAAYLPDE